LVYAWSIHFGWPQALLFSWNYRLVDWYFWSNIFFWLGAFGDQITSIYYLWEEHWLETKELPDDQPFITNLLACYFWTISGMYGAMIWYCDRIDRIAYKTKHRFAMFGPLGDSPTGYRNLFDYRGWGDWCFWPGAILYTISAHGCLAPLELYNSSISCNLLDTAAAIAYLLNSLMYYPDLFAGVRIPSGTSSSASPTPRRCRACARKRCKTWRSNTTTSLSRAIQSLLSRQAW
jgi:hypothetical protein